MRHRFRVAELTIELVVDDPSVRATFTPPFSRFLVSESDPDLTLNVRRGPPLPAGELLFDSGGVWRLLQLGEKRLIECHSEVFGDGPYKTAVLEPDGSHGEIVMHTGTPLNPLEYPLDEVLTNQLLARGLGVELHACGVDDDGRGVLFVGQSGAGKTTTARLWGDEQILSDDRVIVRDHDGALRMHGTPWHGEAELSAPRSVPLHAIYLLVHAGQNDVVPLSPAVAAARLFTCTFPPFHDPAAIAFALQFLARVALTVPVAELHFIPDASVVAFVRERR